MSQRMPAVFFGHGNPLNALADNAYTRAWAAIGKNLPRPKAILAVSAHWYVAEVAVTAIEAPRTIHDFGGFPQKLFDFQYPAPGNGALAKRVTQLLAPQPVREDHQRGLDHGTWSVLCHAYPRADVPVVQLSIDENQPPEFHYELGKKLAPLRDEGVLVIGSGNIVHNLHTYAWGRHSQAPYDWATRFEARARELLLVRNHQPLIDYQSMGQDALLSIPTPEHYLPLLYVIALLDQGDKISFPVEGVDGGSISMLSVQVG